MNELNVDFIGEQGHKLTKEEEQAISDFIKADKAKRTMQTKRKSKTNRSRTRQHT